MIKEEKKSVVKEIIKKSYYCDDCGEKISEDYRKPYCQICEKDLCHKCIGQTEYEGDFAFYYCKDCWTIGESYRSEIKMHEDKIDDLIDEWHSKCKKENKIE